MTEKFISWNVNGLRACMGKGFKNFFDETDADIFALQETKLQEGQIDFAPEGYMGFGIMPKREKVIPERPSSQKKNRFPLLTAWVRMKNSKPRDAS